MGAHLVDRIQAGDPRYARICPPARETNPQERLMRSATPEPLLRLDIYIRAPKCCYELPSQGPDIREHPGRGVPMADSVAADSPP